ncbi:MAG: hypothetical protein HKN41_07340, partial [Ilumatobacter sp.]|nr:hypothetical protein [Ilumatobacter sp.]
MTDDGTDAPDEHHDDSPSAMEGALDRFKAHAPSTDEDPVNDASGAQPRMMWNPVTDTGGSPPDAPTSDDSRDDSSASGFHFDLGGALARLSGELPADEPPASAARTVDPEPTAAPTRPPVAQPP